jgi:hypothetical protein
MAKSSHRLDPKVLGVPVSYANSASIDTEARRYLKHHHLLHAAKDRAYDYLNQTWLHVTRSLNRELRSQKEIMSSTWIELISHHPQHYSGLHWHSLSDLGVYTLTMADVRYYPEVRGEHVIFTISADTPAARERLYNRLVEDRILALYPESLDLASNLMVYTMDSTDLISLCFPLRLDHVKAEAKTLIAWAAPLWGLIESDTEASTMARPTRSAKQSMHTQPSPLDHQPQLSHLKSSTVASSTAISSSNPAQTVSNHKPQRTSRYPSAAPPLDHTPTPDPYSQSNYLDSIQPQALDAVTPEEANHDYLHKRIQSPSRSARLIRGGEPNRPVDQNSTSRFVPRSLPRDPHNSINKIVKKDSLTDVEESTVTPKSNTTEVDSHTEKKPEESTIEQDHKVTSSGDPHQNLADEQFDLLINDAIQPAGDPNSPSTQVHANSSVIASTSDNQHVPINDRLAQIEKEFETQRSTPPSSTQQVPSLPQTAINNQTNEVMGDEVRKPTYIKNIQDALQDNPVANIADTQDHHESTEASTDFDIEALIAALAQCGLSPWRINTYAQNQGKILWLQNGAHIDLNPQGEVILGGENQDETRYMLTQLGIPI